MEEREQKKPAPPYVAYRTLANFLDRFKQGVPGRIDRGLMGTMSGAAQSQVTTALRYLGMISDKGIPQLPLQQYVEGDDASRKSALLETLKKSYPFIWGGHFDLRTATASQLREAFETNTSASGETLQRCVNFFKDAAADAGLEVSPYITQKKTRSNVPRKRNQPRREEKGVEKTPAPVTNSPIPSHHPISFPAQSSLLLSGLFQRLPPPGAPWLKEERERWIQTLQNVLLLEYPES